MGNNKAIHGGLISRVFACQFPVNIPTPSPGVGSVIDRCIKADRSNDALQCIAGTDYSLLCRALEPNSARHIRLSIAYIIIAMCYVSCSHLDLGELNLADL